MTTVAMNETGRRRNWMGVAPALAVAGLLAWLVVDINLRRACDVQDTPYLPICGARSNEPGAAEATARLRAGLAGNPGDTRAYVQLAHLDRSASRPALVEAAARLAPNHPQVRMAEAVIAIEREDWARTAAALVNVVDHYVIPEPAIALARMVGAGQAELLATYIRPGSRWVERVLAQMEAAKAPLAAALPLLVRAHALGVIDMAAARPYLRQLKAAGEWGDAYALWLALRGAPAQLLMNASFDEALEPEGFDWEAPGSSGTRAPVSLAQPAAPRRGVVLEIGFNGRSLPTPVLRQHVFLGEGRYRLRGQMRTAQLRSEQGFAWTIQCTTGAFAPPPATPLPDTAGAWQPFEALLDVPAGCGPVVSLQLAALSPAGAVAGARGKIYFDEFQIETLSHPRHASASIASTGPAANVRR